MGAKVEVKLDRVKKVLYAMVEGTADVHTGNEFVGAYQNAVKSIKGSEYELHFDCRKFRVLGKDVKNGVDMVEILEACIKMYKETGFKKCIFDCTGNKVMGLQIKRIAKQVGNTACEVIS